MKRNSLLIQQRAALQRQIWQIANEVRGSVNGWDFNIMDAIVAGIEGGAA